MNNPGSSRTTFGQSRRLRPVCLCAALAGLLSASPASAANAPEPAGPHHDNRVLVVGNVAAFGDVVGQLTAGGIYQLSFAQSTVTHGPECGGLGCVDPPQWYLHTMLTAGLSTNFDSVDYAAYGQVGAIWRPYSEAVPWLTGVGVALQGIMPAQALGPVARFEILDNLGVQGGMVFQNIETSGADQPTYFVSLDYMRDLLEDLGFK